ncbi:MAG: 2-amino-4-hydroxy-6-hydroxymethyldihydropteridine diphosphokinase [Roseovarius sp.]|nr:2-amino-4-hydroxy-6-hydroxymethyldihydropteridine diphosphokinase [Roseovarius sp.]
MFLIALGANLPSTAGGPAVTLSAALDRLRDAGAEAEAVSRFYKTPCFPPGAGPDYVNAAAQLRFEGGAEEMLALLHSVEASFGRERVQRWGRRTLDLDLIAAGQAVMPNADVQGRWRALSPERQSIDAPDRLILPHPRMQERAFVLVPLADVAPDWTHPVTGLSVTQMVDSLDAADVGAVLPF